MSIVLANWKTAFVRERGSTLLTVWAILMAAGEFIAWTRGSSDARILGSVGFLLLMGTGLAILRLQRGILAQPLFFCLPGYRQSLRALTFSAAMVFGVAWSLFWMPLSQPATSAETGVDLTGSFLMGIVFYLALTTPRLILSRWAFALLRLAAIPLVFVVLTVEVDAREAPFLIWPILMPMLVALCVFVWIRLGNVECVQRGRRIILEDAITRGPAPGPPRTTLPWVEKWLQSQMERQSYLQGGRYVWGQLYVTIGRLLHYWKWILGVLIGVTWLAGYPGQPAANTVFVASGSLVWMQRWPVTSPLLLPGGRRERRRATIGAVVALSLLLMMAALAIVVLSWLLTLFLGGPPAEGPEATYRALQARSVFLACLLVPGFAALGLLGFRVRSLGELVLIVFFVAQSAWLLFALLMEMQPDWAQRIVAAGVFVVPGVFVGGWLFFLLVLQIVSLRRDLANQQPAKGD